MSTAQALQRSIKTEIEEAVQHRCDCDFYSSAIYSGEFSCQTTTSDVIYRAIINGTSDLHTAAELLDYIENWRKTDQTLLHNLFRLRLSQDCPIKISSFNEIECTGTDIGNNKMNTNLRCDKFGGNSDNRNLLLGSGTCYRFEACNGDSDVYGDGEYSGQSGGYYNGSGGNRIESGESSTAASGEDSSSGDDDYFGGITYS